MSEMKQRRTQGGPGGGHGPMGGMSAPVVKAKDFKGGFKKIGRVSVAVQMADGSCLHFGDFVLSIRDCRTKNHGFGHR